MPMLEKLKMPRNYIFIAACLAVLLITQSFSVLLGFAFLFGAPLFFMNELPPYATILERIWQYIYLSICTFIFVFLILPIIIIMPLSFNVEPYFSFTKGMMSFDPAAFSTRWYQDIFHNGMQDPTATGSSWWADMWNNAQWIRATRNSFFIAILTTILATSLGTLAALGLSRPEMPYRSLITSLLISPMIVPLVITATGMFFFYSSPFSVLPDFMINGIEWVISGLGFDWKLTDFHLTGTYFGIILAHTTLGIPFVIITVTATLSGFDRSLIRASQNMGADGWTTFRRVIMPLILPGMISGALFAFITSLDEVVAVIFLADVDQRTIPRQMFSGIREQISPTILAVATILVIISILLLATIEILRRRSEKLRGLAPG
jgi:putative spermidine/putrescine transport system permease protein